MQLGGLFRRFLGRFLLFRSELRRFFCAFWIESIGVIGGTWRSMVVVDFNDCSVFSGG